MLPLFTALFVYGYIAAPALAVYSWIRWWRSQRRKSRRVKISLLGLSTATLAIVSGMAMVAVSSIHHGVFLYVAPEARYIYAAGIALSSIAVLIAAAGAFQDNPLRLKALVVALGSFVLWFLAGSGR